MAFDVKRYRTDLQGHRIEVDVDRSLLLAYRPRLLIDGRRVDQSSVSLGTTRLYGELPDGTPVAVDVSLSWKAELRCTLLCEDGEEQELTEVSKPAVAARE